MRVRDGSLEELGRRVRALRRAKGWTQERLAKEAGVSRDSLMKLEGGVREPRPSTVRKVAEALDAGGRELAGVSDLGPGAVLGPPQGYATIRVEGKSWQEFLTEARAAFDRARVRRVRAGKLRAGVMDAKTALAAARAGTRRKPVGVPDEEAVEFPPGSGLTEAVLEERAARPY